MSEPFDYADQITTEVVEDDDEGGLGLFSGGIGATFLTGLAGNLGSDITLQIGDGGVKVGSRSADELETARLNNETAQLQAGATDGIGRTTGVIAGGAGGALLGTAIMPGLGTLLGGIFGAAVGASVAEDG